MENIKVDIQMHTSNKYGESYNKHQKLTKGHTTVQIKLHVLKLKGDCVWLDNFVGNKVWFPHLIPCTTCFNSADNFNVY